MRNVEPPDLLPPHVHLAIVDDRHRMIRCTPGCDLIPRSSFAQDEVVDLRARLKAAKEEDAAKSKELSTKAEEVASGRARQAALTTRLEEIEGELRVSKESLESVKTELLSMTANAQELQKSASRVVELEATLEALREENRRSSDLLQQELKAAVDSLEKEKMNSLEKTLSLEAVQRAKEEQEEMNSLQKTRSLEAAQRAQEEREQLLVQMADIASALG